MRDVFHVDELAKAQRESGRMYHEFLRVPAMSLGLYAIPAGGVDPQRPHGEDEVYVVVKGRATFEHEGRATDVGPGSVLFVPRGATHRFRDVREDVEVLVAFAPAEGTPG